MYDATTLFSCGSNRCDKDNPIICDNIVHQGLSFDRDFQELFSIVL